MRRILAYSGEIPFTADILNTNRNLLKAMGLLAQDVLGSATSVSGLACGPTTPASLAVSIAAGRIYSMQTVDSAAYSDIGTDTDQVIKQGILPAAITLNCPAPVTTGQSINYLIEAQYQDSDTGSTVLPYYNLANPLSPLSGPGGLGTPQNTQRDGIISLVAKAGFAATTGSQVTPSPDAGYVGLWVVTVAFGATTVVSGNIAQAAGAPFLTASIVSAMTQALADARYLQLTSKTPAEIAASVTPTNTQFFGQPWLWARREGCVLDGSTDDSTAFSKCISVAASTNTSVLIDGPMAINSNISIPQNVQLAFVGNGKLKPASGKTITLGQVPQAGLWQIFDLSAGGLIASPNSGNRIAEVWCEWWGANGDSATVLNNEVPINAAMAMLGASGSGGVARLGTGTFFLSADLKFKTLVSLRGMGYFTLFKAKAGWSGGTRMITATNSGQPMFDSRLENVRINANGFGSISQMIYSDSWQQRSGIFNSTLENFNGDGFFYEHGFGGAAFLQLSHVDIFPNDVASARGAFITTDGIIGFMKLMLDQVAVVDANPWQGTGTISGTALTINTTLSGAPAIGQLLTGASTGTVIVSGSGTSWIVNNSQSIGPVAMTGVQNTTGIQIDGQVEAIINGVDIETIRQGILLTHGAVLTGAGVSGGTAVTGMIQCGSSWTGQIDVGSVKQGNATAVVVDANRAYAIAAVESIDGHLIWPPNPGKAVAAATITGSATPAIAFGAGIGAVAHQATGQQRLTLSTSMDGISNYSVKCSSGDGGAPIIWYAKVDATHFDIFTKSGANVAADASEFSVEVFHRP